MKKSLLLIVGILLSVFLSAQTQESMPQAFSYQAIARDATGKVLSGKKIGMKVEILKGSVDGSAVFAETHAPTSTKTGTVNLMIGQGTSVKGSFSSIDWASGPYFLQLSMDINGGTGYEKVSTTQMMPVPYALYAAKAGTAENGGGSGSSTAKFLLMSEDCGENLTAILRGEVVECDQTVSTVPENKGNSSGEFDMDFSILYLDGIDQELDAVIEEWPAGTKIGGPYYRLLPSTSMGHKCFIAAYDIPKGTHNLKMLVKNKAGDVLKEYPFTLKCTIN